MASLSSDRSASPERAPLEARSPAASGAPDVPHVIERYPGYGARPFADRPEQELVFFGRTAEIERVVHAIMASRLTVLYGVSGVGKTSLLKAGVFAKLLEEGFMPVLVRVGPAESPAALIVAALRGACEREGLELAIGDDTGLWELFKTSVIWRGATVLTPVLVLDQFEEFFRTDPRVQLDPAFRAAFATEIGALSSGVAPERLRRDRDPNAHRLDPLRPDVRLLVSLREEDYGALQDLSPVIPGLFRERVRLEPLTRSEATEAIRGPAAIETSPPSLANARFATPPFELDEGATAALLAFLEGRSGEIEGWEVQQVCSYLEKRVVPHRSTAAAGKVRLGRDDVLRRAGPAAALDAFYLGAIAALPRGQRGRARLLCEEGLLTPGGHRAMLETSMIQRDYGVSDETLARLDELHVVRHAWRIGGRHYELTHDRLAEAVGRNRRWRVPRKYRAAVSVAGVAIVAIVGTGALWAKERIARGDAAERVATTLLEDEFLQELPEFGTVSLADDLLWRIETYVDGANQDDATTLRNLGVTERLAGQIALARGAVPSSTGPEQTAARTDNVSWAERHFRRAIEHFAIRLDRDRDSIAPAIDLARSEEQLGTVLRHKGDVSGARRHHERALELAPGARHAVVNDEPDGERQRLLIAAASAHLELGNDLLAQHALDDALANFNDSIAIARLFGESSAIKPEPQRRLSPMSRLALVAQHHALVGTAETLWELKKPAEAREALRLAMNTADEILQLEAPPAGVRLTHALARIRLAESELRDHSTHSAPKDAKTSVMDQRRVFWRTDAVVRWDPLNALWRRDLAYSRMLVGDAYSAADALPDHREKADEEYTKAITELRQLGRRDPDNVAWKVDLAEVLGKVAAVAWAGRAEAVQRAEEADDLLQKVADLDPTNRAVRLRRARLLIDLATHEDFDASQRLSWLRRASASASEVKSAIPNSASASELLASAGRQERLLLERSGGAARR